MADIHTKCIACGEPLPVGSAFCGKCGAGQRPQSHHSQPPAGTSRPVPLKPKPRPSRAVNLKLVLLFLAAGAAAYIALYRKDLLQQGMDRVKGVVQAPSGPSADDSKKGTTGAAKARPVEYPAMQSALTLLDQVQQDPTNVVTSYQLLQLIQKLDPAANNPDILAGMKITYSLTRLMMGNEAEGLQLLGVVRNGYSGSAFAPFLDANACYAACAACKGAPVTTPVCKACGGSSRCKACQGKGTVAVEAKSGGGFAAAPNKAGKFKAMGDSGTRRATCEACKGGGRCPACEGKGKLRIACEACEGKGRTLDRGATKARLDEVLKETFSRFEYEEKDLVLRPAGPG